MTHRPVSSVMTRDVVTVEEDEVLLEVRRDMDRFHLRHIPVVSNNRLVGLLSHRDLLRVAVSALDQSDAATDRDAAIHANTTAGSVMTRDVETVRADTPLREAVQLLLRNKFGCLPVVNDSGKLLGIVTEHDLLRDLAGALINEEQEAMSTRRRASMTPQPPRSR